MLSKGDVSGEEGYLGGEGGGRCEGQDSDGGEVGDVVVGWLGGEGTPEGSGGTPEGAPGVDSTPSSLPASHSWPSFLSTTGYTNIGICVSDVLCIQSSRLCGFKFFVAEFLFSISTQTFQFCHRCNLDFLMDYFKNEPKVDNLF